MMYTKFILCPNNRRAHMFLDDHGLNALEFKILNSPTSLLGWKGTIFVVDQEDFPGNNNAMTKWYLENMYARYFTIVYINYKTSPLDVVFA